MIAAFPLRGDVAPSEVYALYLLPIAAFVVAAALKATGRDRVMILALAGFVLAFPVVLSLLTAESHGIIWQGRYQLGFAVGLLIFSGVALDKAGAAPREGPKLALVALLMFGLAHWRSVVGLDLSVPMALVLGPLAALVVHGAALLGPPAPSSETRRLAPRSSS